MIHCSILFHRLATLRLSLACLIGVLTLSMSAQTVDQTLSIEDYVNEVLLGEGVSATNISFIGSTEQIGYLTGEPMWDSPSMEDRFEFRQCCGCFLCGGRMWRLSRGQSHRRRPS